MIIHCNIYIMCFYQREQLLHHEQKVLQLEQVLSNHRLYPPDKRAKSRVIQDYVEKEEFLQHEVSPM